MAERTRNRLSMYETDLEGVEVAQKSRLATKQTTRKYK
jgi:hypothetical protein